MFEDVLAISECFCWRSSVAGNEIDDCLLIVDSSANTSLLTWLSSIESFVADIFAASNPSEPKVRTYQDDQIQNENSWKLRFFHLRDIRKFIKASLHCFPYAKYHKYWYVEREIKSNIRNCSLYNYAFLVMQILQCTIICHYCIYHLPNTLTVKFIRFGLMALWVT